MFISVFRSSAGTRILSYGRRSKSRPWILTSSSSFSPKRRSRRRRNPFRTRSAGRRRSRWAETNVFGRRRSGWRVIRCYVCGSGSSLNAVLLRLNAGKLFPWLSSDVCVQIPAPLPTAVSKCPSAWHRRRIPAPSSREGNMTERSHKKRAAAHKYPCFYQICALSALIISLCFCNGSATGQNSGSTESFFNFCFTRNTFTCVTRPLLNLKYENPSLSETNTDLNIQWKSILTLIMSRTFVTDELQCYWTELRIMTGFSGSLCASGNSSDLQFVRVVLFPPPAFTRSALVLDPSFFHLCRAAAPDQSGRIGSDRCRPTSQTRYCPKIQDGLIKTLEHLDLDQ